MNKSKAKGTAFETLVVNFFKRRGFPHVERRALFGHLDRGDIAGVPGVVIECKAEQRIDLAGYMDQVVKEVGNASADTGVAIVKRRNHSVERAYVVMELQQFVRWLQ
jgi:uncharacterized 2Fe-2S/4Fe-4S cluster protein (DUF4445 family)